MGLASVPSVGCRQASQEEPYAVVGQRVVYGSDDRAEAAEAPQVPWVVALVPRERLLDAADAGLSPTFEALHGLCPTERFAAQPAIAECSGVLIAPGVVATAAHCLDRVASCRDYVYLRSYQYARGEGPSPLREFEVLECESTLVRVRSSILDERQLDFVLVTLSEPVPGLAPLTIRRDGALVGESVTSVGASGGLPFKTTSGVVLGVRPEQGDYFDFVADVYAGGSGSGVFDRRGRLLGIHVRGEADFEFTDEACWSSRALPEDGTGGSEQANAIAPILDALCQADPGQEPCADEAPLEPPDAGLETDPRDSGDAPRTARPAATADIGIWPLAAPPLVAPLAPEAIDGGDEPSAQEPVRRQVGGCRVGHGPPGAPATLMLTMLLLRMRRRVALQR